MINPKKKKKDEKDKSWTTLVGSADFHSMKVRNYKL